MEYREWMRDPSKRSEEYVRGVNEFLEFAFQNPEANGKILCPCTKCANYKSHSRTSVYEHLTDPRRGFLRGYRQWIFHGEKPTAPSSTTEQHVEMEHDMDGLIRDVFATHPIEEPSRGEGERNPEVGENAKFYQLVKENEQMLYPNCKKYSKLSFVVHLYHLKCLHGWSDKSFSMLLDLLRDVLPEGNVLPKSYYETKKIVSGLGLGYEKIHACPNDCILYRDRYIKDQVCPKCGKSRWKTTNENVQANGTETSEKRKNLPAKILRWFPLKPRLQRLFMSSEIAESMRWHHEGRLNDGSLRHPADSLAWKEFDSRYPTFSLDPRNVRLGVASDGFNPFKTMSITHSTWPVMLIPYNLPPWMCMKQSFMLSLLISGPKGPGNNIDIYLQPLVQELQELWDDGIETFDAYKKETFQLHAAIMWTINDFPAYANLSGWSTKGQYACPCCGIETASLWLRHGRKFCYMCHRRWLAPNHKWRLNSRDFDGTREFRDPPRRLDGIEILRQIDEIGEEGLADGAQPWKKKSIFFTLPYWQYNVLRHNLDVMHIEKNVCDNIIGTLLNQEGKSKDNYKARADLVDMGIRSMLHPQPSPKSSTMLLPRACYQMTTKEKNDFLSILKNIKAPDECSSNISCCVQVKQRKIFGLKSYDCHVLMQQLLPVALRGSLPDKVTSIMVDLCNFFKQICSKVLNMGFLAQLESQIAITLCQLETIFPPSFFTVMMHLVIHLAYEAKVAGPVQYRWMYPIERFLLTLKSFVRNRAHPEGSIAEGFLANECLTFCSQYLSGVETRFNRPSRNDDEIDSTLIDDVTFLHPIGRPLGRKKQQKLQLGKRKRVSRTKLDNKELMQAHRYVLSNCDAVAPFIEEHIGLLKRQSRSRRLSQVELDKQHSQKFSDWFRDRIHRLDEQRSPQVTPELRWLARGPFEVVRRYTGYAINGFRFHTKKRERYLKTQNSGVVVRTKTSKDETNYYGAITDIIQLDYSGKYKAVLFKCDWVDIKKGVKKDKFGMTLVNFNFLKHTGKDICDDPFVFASQAKKVFYVYDERNKDWPVVLDARVRDIYDMGDEESNEIEEIHKQPMHDTSEATQNDNDLIGLSVDDDNDFFEVVVDVDNHIDHEDEEEEREDINGKKKKIKYWAPYSEGSNQHIQASDNEGTQSIPTHTTLTHAQGSNAEETRPSPSHIEGVIHESVESHSIPSDIEAEAEQIEKEPKRLRGPTRMLDVWDMEGGDFIIVNLDKYGRPVGEEGTTLTRFIGSMARRHQYARIDYKSWKDMPKEDKDAMLGIIESKFEFVPPINDKTREMLKSELNEKWRQWKSDLKSMAYDPSKTEEEIASTLPDDRVEPNQYRELVRYWFSEEGQKVSKINKQNRAKFEDLHCMGTKSLAKLIDEKKKKGKGVSPERKEIYIDTRTRKDGSIVNEKAARLIEELNKHDNEAETSQLAQKTQSHMPWMDDIFSQVQGPEKRGRVRCMGKIPKPKKSKVSLSENQELHNRVKQVESLLVNVMSLIQNRLLGEDVNDIMQAARQVTDASSAPEHTNSPNPDTNEDNEYGED